MSGSVARTVAKNGAAVGVRITLSAAMTFLYYRFLLVNIGASALGVWAILSATAGLMQFASLGLPTGVLRGIAALTGREPQEARVLLHTSVLTVVAAVFLLFPLFYWGGGALLRFSLSQDLLSLAVPVFPLVLVGMGITVVGSIYQSVLDGSQKFTVSSWIVLLGNVCFVVAGVILVPRYGLTGLGYASIIQAVVVAVAMICSVQVLFPEFGWFPSTWQIAPLRQIASMGVNLQAILLLGLCTDPLAKMLVNQFGSISSVGYYELATRLTGVVRQVLVSMNQVVIPVVAQFHGHAPARVVTAYHKNYQSMFFVSVAVLMGVAAFSQFVSVLWIGTLNDAFILATVLLALGWMANAIASPAYFFFFGKGQLGWCTLSHVAMLSVMFVFANWFGGMLGYPGAVLGITIGILAGSLVTVLSYNRIVRLPLLELLSGGNAWPILVITGATAAVLAGSSSLIGLLGLMKALLFSMLLYGISLTVGMKWHPGAASILNVLSTRTHMLEGQKER